MLTNVDNMTRLLETIFVDNYLLSSIVSTILTVVTISSLLKGLLLVNASLLRHLRVEYR
jgi:hypothetical protein